jgi:hypothetical protein
MDTLLFIVVNSEEWMLIKSSSEKNLEFPNPSIEKSLKSSHFFRNHVSYVFVVNEIILGKLS